MVNTVYFKPGFPRAKQVNETPFGQRIVLIGHHVDETGRFREAARLVGGRAATCVERDFVVLESNGVLRHDPGLPIDDESGCSLEYAAVDSWPGPNVELLNFWI